MRKKYLLALALGTMLAAATIGCGKKEETNAPVTTEKVTTEAPKEDPHKGMQKSNLTGEWIDEKVANKRPVAIMLNNIKAAIPQSNVSKAEITYEILVEGGITRMLLVMQDYEGLDKIGPVRSARHYYVDIADEYNAIYMHFGQTKYAVAEIDKIGIDTLSGLSSIGNSVYYRDKKRKAPHNAYTSSEGIKKGIELSKYETLYSSSANQPHFQFQEEDTDLTSGNAANKITLGYSTYTTPWFEYNTKTKEYLRFQYNDKHIDDQNNQQLSYKNVIIQSIKEWNIDKKGYQTMELVSSGKGYYCTNGKCIPITWSKDSVSSPTKFFDETGDEIKVNPGKTFISVFPRDRESKCVIN